ncbi:hypothetical protein NMY22_g18347 [Coprinellus aureogranulatus]|nr:hypothetical protein NMY22_g18347 [Coprinellus aureogranulatus]
MSTSGHTNPSRLFLQAEVTMYRLLADVRRLADEALAPVLDHNLSHPLSYFVTSIVKNLPRNRGQVANSLDNIRDDLNYLTAHNNITRRQSDANPGLPMVRDAARRRTHVVGPRHPPQASLFTVPGSSSAPSAQGPTSIPSGTAADAFEAAQLEIVQGTNVPSASSFPSETQGIAAAVEEIKASSGEWCCKEHGPTCYVDALGHHHGMNRYRYVGWGTFLVANPNAHPRDGPPESLVSSWRGTPHVNPSSTARKAVRGRTGNGRSAPVDLFESPSMIQLGAAIASAVSAGMAQAATTSDLKKSRTRSHTPPSSPARPSSPPPAIEDELDAFLTAFKAARGVADDQISALSNVLHARKYTPEGLCDVHLTVDHFRQLTGLEEGEVLTLLSFARRWTGRIEQKRIKRARYSL